MLHKLSFEVKSGERVGIGKSYEVLDGCVLTKSIQSAAQEVGRYVPAECSCHTAPRLTGGPQSSLTLALLRCILTEGKVYYDRIPTDSINLDALRSNITIIPQMVCCPSVLHSSSR